MKNIAVIGRLANVINLNVESMQSDEVGIMTGSTVEEAKKMINEPIDIAIIGAGLDIDDRLEITRLVLENTPRTTIYMNSKDSGPEGLGKILDNAINSITG